MSGHDTGHGAASSSGNRGLPGPIGFLFENSLFLIGGAILALIWANGGLEFISNRLTAESYNRFIHAELTINGVDESVSGRAHAESAADHEAGHDKHPITLHFLVNDVLMALFFAIAAKEVWESLLPGGPLSNPRKAATPLMATLGGVVAPAAIYAAGAYALGRWDDLGRGWAVPCATDIAFSYLVARLIFGDTHPAIPFLLLLAIADDGLGLIILAIFYPTQAIQPAWLLLTAAAIATGFILRGLGVKNFWFYLVIPGVMSWLSFYKAGIHAALGLVPIIPTMPHAHSDIGFFTDGKRLRHDTLSEFEHWWDHPVELILGLFGLVNAGVAFSNVGTGTSLVMLGLILGKPLGIFLFTWFATRALGLQMPEGVSDKHIVTLGVVAGIGFTVALFVATTAFRDPGPVQDAVKMGALGSFASAILAFPVAWALGVKRIKCEEVATTTAKV
ncbi:MAG: Na+/H+ antiporter NhaA [Planctomycetaceae bacterium]